MRHRCRAGQLRNLERALGEEVRLCDRTALILDIFSQRAATREGKLQVRRLQHSTAPLRPPAVLPSIRSAQQQQHGSSAGASWDS